MRDPWAPWGWSWACVGYRHPTEPPASESLKTFEKRADRGDARAEYTLGQMYLEGRGVRLDEGEAARWYRKAAERGYAAAENALGFLYDSGQAVPEDHVEAARWYRKAARQGDLEAEFNLGALDDIGQGVPLDHAQAARWYRKAARRGIIDAQFQPGRDVRRRAGRRPRYRRGGALVSPGGQARPAYGADGAGRSVREPPRPAQDLVEALRWYPKAAERAYAPALHELAQAYATGRGVPADDVEAYLWMDLAAFRARGALREQCLAERDGFARTMSPEQVAQAERRELEWKKKWAP